MTKFFSLQCGRAAIRGRGRWSSVRFSLFLEEFTVMTNATSLGYHMFVSHASFPSHVAKIPLGTPLNQSRGPHGGLGRALRAVAIVLLVLYTTAIDCCPLSIAGLLIDPSGGVVLWDSSSGDRDDQVQTRALPFSAQLFGATLTTVGVSTNGNWNLGGSNAYINVALPTASGIGAMFAPLWDDLLCMAVVAKASSRRPLDRRTIQ